MKHLQYEGPELEELLDHVHNTHGTDAKIVKADKAREGGIAGFFAREVFHVVVAVDDEAKKAKADEPERSATSEEDLWSIVAAGAAATSTEENGAEFAQTLGRLLSEDPPAPASPAVAPARLSAVPDLDPSVVPDVDISEVQTPKSKVIAAPAVFPTVEPVQVIPEPVVAASPTPEEITEPQLAPEFISPEPVMFGTPVEVPAPAPAPVQAPDPVPAPVAQPAIKLSVSPGQDQVQETSSSVVALSSRRIQRQVEGSGSFQELVSAFESANISAPSLPTSGVVAVVGSVSEAEPLATKMAEVAGGGAGDILVLSPNEQAALPSAAEIIGLAAQLRSRRGLSVVVIELLPGLSGHMWATQILAHLSATQVRLVVGAHRSPEGTSIAAQALGRIDVVDLVELHEIEEPERFLELGIPVGSLDTFTPTSALWVAASVTSRMNHANRAAEAITQHGQLAR